MTALTAPSIVKADGKREPFDEEKLRRSLRKARASEKDTQAVVEHIRKEVTDGMTTEHIFRHAFEVLHKLHKGAAVSYSLRRALLELGPSGFPFEKFVAEIFKRRGYKTLTDQTVLGGCVAHEVDIIAWKPAGESLVMVEAKFHNQLGLKTDLKVALYVKARFDDIAKASFVYDDKTYRLETGMLITNTKFSISAIQYSECQAMKIIGWNYPLDGNLQDLVESANLHPLTCLRSLSDRDKKTLLEQGTVLCIDLEKNPALLRNIGLAEANIEQILHEINHIYTTHLKKV
jgi:hypothetical protein